MSNHHENCNCCCCKDQPESIHVEHMTLDDGRKAERHTSKDENGNEVVEIFAEEKRPLKIEKRIVKESKRIVAKEIHETIKDGEVQEVEIKSLEPEVPLQVRERLGTADHHKLVDGDYVRREEIGKLVQDGVISGVAALLENMEPPVREPVAQPEPVPVAPIAPVQNVVEPEPVLKAQSVVANNVAQKAKNDGLVTTVMAVILLAQLGFFGYMFLVM